MNNLNVIDTLLSSVKTEHRYIVFNLEGNNKKSKI